MTVPFTFAIPLLPRAFAHDWALVEHLLGLTLASVFAQTDQRFRVIVIGHDRPGLLPEDGRMAFLQADWPPEAVHADNRDRGRKTFAANRHVLERGGGLLMFLDADDWVDARLVEAARAAIGPEHAGGIIDTGFAVDFRSLRAAPLPHPRVFDGGFHRLCGSSAVLRLDPGNPDPLRRDPYARLHEHYRMAEAAYEAGLRLAWLPVPACYLVNTSDSHSELHGPYAEWRRSFNRAVNREGRAVDRAFLARFGLRPEQVRTDWRRAAEPVPALQ